MADRDLINQMTRIMLDESFVAPSRKVPAGNTGEIAGPSIHTVMWNAFAVFADEDIWLTQ